MTLAAGRPAYHPPTLVKIYLYGCLNRVQSSRRLEREAQRNIELRGLTGQLLTSAGTMARRAELVRGRFVEVYPRPKLFTGAVVAIAGRLVSKEQSIK